MLKSYAEPTNSLQKTRVIFRCSKPQRRIERNLKTLSDDALLLATERAAKTERDALADVLRLLHEIDRRRLYSTLKFKSLFEYAVKQLKYSESEACLRISAMRLLKEIPELEPKINSGSLRLTNLAIANRAFAHETERKIENGNPQPKRTAREKLALIEQLENVSKRDAIKIIEFETGISTSATEGYRELQDGKLELKIIVSKGALDLIDHLKGFLAHSKPNISTGELLELALGALKNEVDPLRQLSKAEAAAERHELRLESDVGLDKNIQTAVGTFPEKLGAAKNSSPSLSKFSAPRSHIPVSVRRAVWRRAGGLCANCASNYALQIEHVIPHAKGGTSHLENLKLLCRPRNQRSAIEQFGLRKMQNFIQSPTSDYLTA